MLSLGKNGTIAVSRKKSTSGVFASRKGSFMLKNLTSEDDDFIVEDMKYESITHKTSDISFWLNELAHAYMKSNITRIVILFAAILSCIIYVVETYLRHTESDAFIAFALVSDLAIFIIFLMDYIFNIVFAANKRVYIFSMSGIIDFTSLFAVANLFITTDLSFLPLFRLMRVIKIIRLFRTASIMNVERPTPPSASEAITFEIISLIVGMVVSIFLASAVLFTITQEFENTFIYSFDDSFSMKDDATFFDCVYIVLEILSTLGFGDFIPGNFLGRFYVVAVLAIALTIIPMKVGQLIDIIGKKPRYLNEYITGSDSKPHIIVYADLNHENFQRFVLLILSQGTNDPEVVEDAQPIALMSPVFPSPQLQLLLLHPINARKVQFFVGSVKSSSDLRRVKAPDAMAVFIFVDSDIAETIHAVEQDDYTSKLKAVSVINHLNEELGKRGKEATRPTVIAQTYSHDVCFSLLVYGVDKIISVINMKYSLLAYSSLFPGFLCIVNNLTIPNNFYNAAARLSADNVITKKNEYEWGDSFELVEIPVKTNTSDGVKKLTFSLCCRFLYEWSKGTTVLVGIHDHVGCDVVVLNPLRDALIGDCGSLFVICNSLEVTLAMLKTPNPKRVWRRHKANLAQQEKKNASGNAGIELQSQGSFWKDLYQDPNALAPNISKYDQFELQKTSISVDPKQLKFSRNSSCYRNKKRKRLNSLNSLKEFSANNRSFSTRREDSDAPDNGLIRARRSTSNSDINPASSFMETRPPVTTRQSSKLGKDLNRVPTSSIRLGQNDGEYMFSKKYKEHVVLVCAFSPTHAVPRIANAIITFVNAFRVRSDEAIVVLAVKADSIEEYARKQALHANEAFDDNLTFVHGLPNTIRGLQSVDVCHARCICIIGCEFKSKKFDPESVISQSKQDSEEVNTDLYIVLAALELDAILSSYIRRLLREKRQAPLPVVIQEISSDATISFLPDYYTLSRKAMRLWENYDKKLWESGRGMNLEEVDTGFKFNKRMPPIDSQPVQEVDEDIFVSSTPALAQGRVLTKHVVDGLTIKMLFNPHIVEFWQTVTGMEKSNFYSSSEERENMLGQGSFDKLDIPESFQGTYRELFEVLLVTFGAVAIGLNRFPENGSSYVAVMPPPDAIVSNKDQVFVFLTHAAAVAEDEEDDEETVGTKEVGSVHHDNVIVEADIILNLAKSDDDDDDDELELKRSSRNEERKSTTRADIMNLFTI